jgi:hypothetical protein
MSITRVHVDVEVTNEDESVGVDSVNSDATRRTPTPRPVEDSYSIVDSGAVSTVPHAVQPAIGSASRWSHFLCCYRSRPRRRKLKDSAEHPSCQLSEINLQECVKRLEEKIKSCQVHSV